MLIGGPGLIRDRLFFGVSLAHKIARGAQKKAGLKARPVAFR